MDSVSPVAIDHALVLCERSAPEAAELAALGLREGSPNTHPGQGTACRRFFFDGFYLELLWVEDETLARLGPAARTGLWERWRARISGACPFGLVMRPAREGVPALFFLGFQAVAARRAREPTDHALPLGALRALTLHGAAKGRSPALGALVAAGLVTYREAEAPLLEMAFFRPASSTADARTGAADLQPRLPLVLRWGA